MFRTLLGIVVLVAAVATAVAFGSGITGAQQLLVISVAYLGVLLSRLYDLFGLYRTRPLLYLVGIAALVNLTLSLPEFIHVAQYGSSHINCIGIYGGQLPGEIEARVVCVTTEHTLGMQRYLVLDAEIHGDPWRGVVRLQSAEQQFEQGDVVELTEVSQVRTLPWSRFFSWEPASPEFLGKPKVTKV